MLTIPLPKVGTGELSVAKEVAEVQKLLRASGLTCTMHSAGTTVEGSWDEVMRVIGQAHSLVHQLGVVRIQTSMRVGTRYVLGVFLFAMGVFFWLTMCFMIYPGRTKTRVRRTR